MAQGNEKSLARKSRVRVSATRGNPEARQLFQGWEAPRRGGNQEQVATQPETANLDLTAPRTWRSKPVLMFRRFAENPVFLRDLGWKYTPPLFGILSRRKAQAIVALTVVLGLSGLTIWLERRWEGSGVFTLVVFSGIGYIALLVRSSVTGITAWQRDRDLRCADELILTGLSAEEFAEAKVFARGFVFVAGGVFLSAVALAAVAWCLVSPSFDNLIYFENLSEVTNIVSIILIAPALITNLYLKTLRLGLRKRTPIFRALTAVAVWVLAIPAAILGIAGMISMMAELTHGEVYPWIAFLLAMQVPIFWLLVYAGYRELVADIRKVYLEASAE